MEGMVMGLLVVLVGLVIVLIWKVVHAGEKKESIEAILNEKFIEERCTLKAPLKALSLSVESSLTSVILTVFKSSL